MAPEAYTAMKKNGLPDLIMVTDMLNLPVFESFANIEGLPIVSFFHENPVLANIEFPRKPQAKLAKTRSKMAKPRCKNIIFMLFRHRTDTTITPEA